MVCKSPLKWPAGTPRTKVRKTALFGSKSAPGYGRRSVTVHEALNRLSDELRRLGVRDLDGDVIIMTDMKVGIGGTILSSQSAPADPGVVVHWEAGGKQRTMSIDIYNTVADNIVAVAKVLDYLRGIERHGGSVIQDQAFSGFDALPPPDDCWKILTLEKRVVLGKPLEHRKALIMDAFRIEARDGHGKGVDMQRLVSARDEALKLAGV